MNLYREQYNSLRDRLLEDIRKLLPDQQEYVDIHLPYCAGIKYIDEKGIFGTYECRFYQINPHCIDDDLPVESLIVLLEKLQEKSVQWAKDREYWNNKIKAKLENKTN